MSLRTRIDDGFIQIKIFLLLLILAEGFSAYFAVNYFTIRLAEVMQQPFYTYLLTHFQEKIGWLSFRVFQGKGQEEIGFLNKIRESSYIEQFQSFENYIYIYIPVIIFVVMFALWMLHIVKSKSANNETIKNSQ